MSLSNVRALTGSMVALALVGCVADEIEEETALTSNEVRGGTPANAFPEAVIVDYADGSGCSGAVITPRVVLTAGHCAVPSALSFSVLAPFAGGQRASGTRAAVFDYPERNPPYVPRRAHDVGLLFLDAPITLAQYPRLATWELAEGDRVIVVGRVNDGRYSATALFRETVRVRDGKRLGFPFSYDGENVVQAGDSGGPDFLPGTHVIAAVNSAQGGLLARVDLVVRWIEDRVAENGGFMNGGGLAHRRAADKKDDGKKKRR